MKTVITFLSIIVIFVVSCNPFKTYWYKEFNSKKHNEKIFINCIGLGVTGDHRIVKISNSKNKSVKQNDKEYFLNNFSYVFYKFQNDTLFIYSEERFTEPKINTFETVIFFNEINMRDYNNDKYKNLGLRQISPYLDSN